MLLAADPSRAWTEDWSGLSGSSWAEGTTHGAWRVIYNGFGTVGIEAVSGVNVLAETPTAPSGSGVTHAGLLVTTASYSDVDVTAQLRTVSQTRTGAYSGAVANPWERAWLLWNYTDDTHFYSFVLKANGWELGKEDPAYPGAQRYLATGTTPTSAVGAWSTVRVTQVGALITAYVDGIQVAQITDTERPYSGGQVGLYNEDSHVQFGPVTIIGGAPMAGQRALFGFTPSDFAVTVNGTTAALTAMPGAVGTVFSTQGGSEQLTDLLDASSQPITTVTADSNGRVAFYGPAAVTECWIDFGAGRFRMLATGSKSSDPAVAVWTPSDPAGGVDVTAELEAFRAANLGKVVRVPAGATIKLNSAFASATTGDILLDLTAVTVLYDASSTAGCAIKADNTSAASAEVSVSTVALAQVNTDAWVTQLGLGSTLGAAARDWVAVYSSDANPAHSGGFLGEIAQTLNAESSLNLALSRKLNRHAFYTSAVKARKLSAARKLWIKGGTFKANGNTEDTLVTTRADAIWALGWVDARFEDIAFDHPWSRGLRLQCCAAPVVRNVGQRDVGNVQVTAAALYAVSLYGMVDAADVRGLVARNGRHAFTTEGSTTSSTWWQKGIPTNAVVDGVHGTNCAGALVDTHEEGDNVVITNVVAEYGYQDADAAGGSGFTGTAVQLRCSNTTVRGLTVTGGTRGVRVPAVNHGFEDRVIVEDVRVMDTTHATDGDIGVQVDDQSSLANLRHVIVRGSFDNVGTILAVGKKAKVTVPQVAARRCKTFLDAGAGSDIVFTGPADLDFRGSTRLTPYSGVLARSDGTNGGCSVVFMKAPTLIKGTGTTPASFVTEADSTAPKRLWVPEVIVLDQTSSGVPTVVPAGQTTFQVANVFKVDGFYATNPPGNPGGPGNPGAVYPQDLLAAISSFELTLPTGPTNNPDDVYESALATYSNSSWFRLNTAKDGIEFLANAGGTATSGSSFARSELREMNAGYTLTTDKAAWNAADGNSHTMTVTQSIDQLPINRPILVNAQIHAAGSQSYLLITADGFRPSTTTTAVTGTSTQPFTIMAKINDSGGTQQVYVPILTNYVMGQTFTVKLEAVSGKVNIYCDVGTTATTLKYTDSIYVPSGANLYFKTGCYLQSNTTNGQTVPHNSAAGGVDLTSPSAGSTIAGDASGVTGKVTIRALSVVHSTAPIGDVQYPADIAGPEWKITLPDASEIKQPDFATYSGTAFSLTADKTGAVFSCRCNGATTPNTTNPRSELREMTGSPAYATLAAWDASTGTHTMIYTASIDELPVKKPEVTVGQVHSTVDPPDDQLVVLGSGFYPSSGTAAVTGTNTSIGFDLRCRWLGSTKLGGVLLPVLIPNLHIGEKFSIKIQAASNRYRIWAKKDPTGAKDFTGVAEATASVNLTYVYTGVNYFKLGVYVQSNLTNSGKTVPTGTCAGGSDLTSPVAGSATGGDAATAGGKVTVYGTPTITHV